MMVLPTLLVADCDEISEGDLARALSSTTTTVWVMGRPLPITTWSSARSYHSEPRSGAQRPRACLV